MSLIEQEPLLRTRKERPSIIPIDPEFSKQWELYKKALSNLWTVEEVDLEDDTKHWPKLDRNVQEFIENIFGFFSGADGIVNDNLAQNFMNQINIPEVKAFYGFQIAMEIIHNEMYGILIDRLVTDKERKEKLLDAINEMPNISKLYSWCKRWIHRTAEQELEENPLLDSSNPVDKERAEIWVFAKRLVAFACVEGIMFSGPFCAIFWLKELGILPGLTFSNELISRDEGLHTEFACLLYSMVVNKPPADQILDIVKEVVEFEQEFICSCLDRLVGINKTNMSQYIEFVADKVLVMMGYKKHWNTPLPAALKFMEKISFNGLTNFFEKKVGEYALSGVGEEVTSKKGMITSDF